MLSDRNDPDATELLQSLDFAWVLTLGVSSLLAVCFFGRERTTAPVKLVQNELVALLKAIRAVEQRASPQ